MASVQEPPRNGSRVLLVDDENMLLMFAKRALTNFGHTVTALASGPEALAAFEAAPDEFDIVVTDHTMPKMTGAELIEALRAIRPELPMILTSGYGESLTQEMISTLKPAAFLHKPYSHVELDEAVRKAVNSSGGDGHHH